MLVMIAGIFGLIGYIVWDRKTALRPVEQRLIALESEFHRDLEIQHEEGSRLTRLVKVLREMAKSDEKLANVLRTLTLIEIDPPLLTQMDPPTSRGVVFY
jgi:hypothetical protein